MNRGALQLAQILGDLHAQWKPHDAQKLVLQAIFGQGKSTTMLECGRKFGKTEVVAYFLWRLALTVPGEYYYFTPLQNQGREIVWANRRLQTFGSDKYIKTINESEMRILFKNGSFIKVDGSDNFDKYRGPNPMGAVYDEFRDFRPEFHPAFGPNLATHSAPLLICGTPPEIDIDHYDAMLTECSTESDQAYFNFPSWANPHIPQDWLKRQKRKLYARGDGDEWEREYAARKVRGGKKSIFPMYQAPDKERNITHTAHYRPHAEVMEQIRKDRKKLIWQIIADPGNMSVFGVLFRAINPFTKVVYRLDEIYETSQMETSTSKIMPRIQAMRDELYPEAEGHGVEWDQHCDEAAAWFITEALNSFGEQWTPTQKAQRPIDNGLSLMKDQFLGGLTIISDRCINLSNELKNFIKDPKTGKPHAACSDHLIDCDRYGNDGAGIDLAPEDEPKEQDPDDARRFRTPEEDLDDEMHDRDEAFGILDDF